MQNFITLSKTQDILYVFTTVFFSEVLPQESSFLEGTQLNGIYIKQRELFRVIWQESSNHPDTTLNVWEVLK